MGAALPSSQCLARTMANRVPIDDTTVVVELGGGTGVVTQALIDAGVHVDRFHIVERSPELAAVLKDRFPQQHIVEGDAANLTSLFADISGQVDLVISSLPLRSLPQDLVESILGQIHQILRPGGHLVQFTYDLRGHRQLSQQQLMKKYFQFKNAKNVWTNLPPARVEHFTSI